MSARPAGGRRLPRGADHVPGPEFQERIRSAIRDVERHYGFAESFLRTSKVGSRLDVEIDFVVADASTAQTVRQFDDIRAELQERLGPLGDPLAMSVGFTADRRWVQ